MSPKTVNLKTHKKSSTQPQPVNSNKTHHSWTTKMMIIFLYLMKRWAIVGQFASNCIISSYKSSFKIAPIMQSLPLP